MTVFLSFCYDANSLLSVQHYRIISTPDGNQTVAMKSSSREADLDNRVKAKSDRFCMHT